MGQAIHLLRHANLEQDYASARDECCFASMPLAGLIPSQSKFTNELDSGDHVKSPEIWLS